MVANLPKLLKNYRFVFKLIGLVLACVCLGILSHDENFLIPRWLWLIYCTNSLTYIIILMTMSGNYILEENCEYLDAAFSIIGIPLYFVAGIGAITRSAMLIPVDANSDSCEFVLGILFIVSGSLMLSQIVWSTYINKRAMIERE